MHQIQLRFAREGAKAAVEDWLSANRRWRRS